MKRRVYIAGPMSGVPQFNYPAFRAAAVELRRLGYFVISPVEIGEAWAGGQTEHPPQEYLRHDIEHLVHCDAIALLPDWDRSVGARCEAAIALTLGLAFMDGHGTLITPPASITIASGYPSQVAA